MTRKRRIIIAVIITAGIGVGILTALRVDKLFSDRYTIERLSIGDIKVVVEADTSWEVGQGIYVRASAGKWSLPTTLIGSTVSVDSLRFSLIALDGQSPCAALVEDHHPDIVLAVIRLDSGQSWPGNMSMDEAKKVLQRQPKNKARLRLSDEVPGNEDRLIS